MLARGRLSYSVEDFMNLAEADRAEFWDGTIYDMSPAPSTRHQQISREIVTSISNYLKNKECQVFYAPFDVFLLDDNLDEIKNARYILQPDISVICDKNKITNHGCKGAPDFIIEIVSPSSKAHDYIKKLNIYNDYGVKEYWVVDPEKEIIMVYLREDNTFTFPQRYGFDSSIKVNIFEDLFIDFSQFDLIKEE